MPRLLVIENDTTDPLGVFADWLSEAGVAVTTLRPYAGEAIPDAVPADGLLVLGGEMGAGDEGEYPWLAQEKALLRSAVAAEVPTLALCLGAQLLAAANGGQVARMARPEIGAQLVAKRASASSDPLFATLPITPDVLQWHYDEIVTLPPGAIHLASGPACENQAFRLGRLAWGVQFHLELTPDMVRSWAAADTSLDGDTRSIVQRRALDALPEIAETWRPFLLDFVKIVADPAAVPAARGVAAQTAGPITDPAAIRAALAAEAGAARVHTLPMPQPRPDGRD